MIFTTIILFCTWPIPQPVDQGLSNHEFQLNENARILFSQIFVIQFLRRLFKKILPSWPQAKFQSSVRCLLTRKLKLRICDEQHSGDIM